MTAAIIIVIAIIVMETISVISSQKYGIKYNPILVNLINIIRYSRKPEKYMGYAYSQIIDQDKYFGEVKKTMLKKGVDPEYADSIMQISKNMMNVK